MFVLNILCHNLVSKNRPQGWVRTDLEWVRNVLNWARIIWVRKIHGYETTGNHCWEAEYANVSLTQM